MDLQDLIAIAVAAGAAGYACRLLWRSMNAGGCGGTSCGCGQSSGAKPGPSGSQNRITAKPLVTIDKIGLPNTRDNAPHQPQA